MSGLDGLARQFMRGHYWQVDLGDRGKVASDDLTLDEVQQLEELTGQPWAILNPMSNLKSAKAWLLVAAMHVGMTVDEAEAHLCSLNLGGIKAAFQFMPGDAPNALDDGDDHLPPSSAHSSVAG